MDKTIGIENNHMPPFFRKLQLSIKSGKGVYVRDEDNNRYLDFTSGWGVTSIGHANEVITAALIEQGNMIIQNPNSGLTYSPARARLLELLIKILPAGLTRVFFSNSGAEANDAAIKLARKVTGRMDVISAKRSFHGRTISTASATGQVKHREKFNPLMPNYRFIEYNNLPEMEEALDGNAAAVILEPIQGEGGINMPSANYLTEVEKMCRRNSTLLIIDEVQTGFCRTGPMFVSSDIGIRPDILTMAKGIAGGFPFGGFAVTEEVSEKLETGDHGGTYCGNPLGCAVSHAVIKYLLDNNIPAHVREMGKFACDRLEALKAVYPDKIKEIRGQGLLLLTEMAHEKDAEYVVDFCLKQGLILNLIQGKCIRLIPALNIKMEEMDEGLSVFEKAVEAV